MKNEQTIKEESDSVSSSLTQKTLDPFDLAMQARSGKDDPLTLGRKEKPLSKEVDETNTDVDPLVKLKDLQDKVKYWIQHYKKPKQSN